MKMTQDTDVLKEDNAELLAILKEMLTAVREAAHQGTAIHEVERAVWQQVLLIGRAALSQFLTLLGPGDMGESVTLPGGQVCQRLEETHSRRYVSIFGEFVLKRTVSVHSRSIGIGKRRNSRATPISSKPRLRSRSWIAVSATSGRVSAFRALAK